MPLGPLSSPQPSADNSFNLPSKQSWFRTCHVRSKYSSFPFGLSSSSSLRSDTEAGASPSPGLSGAETRPRTHAHNEPSNSIMTARQLPRQPAHGYLSPLG